MQCQLDPEIPRVLLGDPAQLQQVLQDLLERALAHESTVLLRIDRVGEQPTLKLRAGRHSEELRFHAPPEEDPQTEDGFRVLVAEDNPVVAQVLALQLRGYGHQVTVAGNGLEAVEKANDTAFDAILMDCQMPKMDGYEATRVLRRKGKQTPILALTTNSQLGEACRCQAAGMDDYLVKPVGAHELHSLLSFWVANGHED